MNDGSEHDWYLSVMPTTILICAVGALLVGLLPVAAVLGGLGLLLMFEARQMTQAAVQVRATAGSKFERDLGIGCIALMGALIGLPLIIGAFVWLISWGM